MAGFPQQFGIQFVQHSVPSPVVTHLKLFGEYLMTHLVDAHEPRITPGEYTPSVGAVAHAGKITGAGIGIGRIAIVNFASTGDILLSVSHVEQPDVLPFEIPEMEGT